jgi:hypothetical protein
MLSVIPSHPLPPFRPATAPDGDGIPSQGRTTTAFDVQRGSFKGEIQWQTTLKPEVRIPLPVNPNSVKNPTLAKVTRESAIVPPLPALLPIAPSKGSGPVPKLPVRAVRSPAGREWAQVSRADQGAEGSIPTQAIPAMAAARFPPVPANRPRLAAPLTQRARLTVGVPRNRAAAQATPEVPASQARPRVRENPPVRAGLPVEIATLRSGALVQIARNSPRLKSDSPTSKKAWG